MLSSTVPAISAVSISNPAIELHLRNRISIGNLPYWNGSLLIYLI